MDDSSSSALDDERPRRNKTERDDRDRRTDARQHSDREQHDDAGQVATARDTDEDSGDAAGNKSAPQAKNWLRRPVVLITGGAILVLIIIGVLLWWSHARKFESTDDAFIDAHVVRVSPRISGQVIGVYAEDNQLVRIGDVLVDIDPAEIRATLDQIRAQQAQAETALGQAQADVRLAQAQYAQAVANARGAAAQAVNAAQDLKRYQALQASTPQAVAQGQIDQAVAAARNAAAQRDAAQQQAKSATAQIAAAQAGVAGAQARIDTARAQVRESQLNLAYTRVVAPMDGHIARRSVAVGTYVSPGQQMLAIVPLQVWVTANFKETQLARMRVGQSVSVTVDACPGIELRAHVDSVQRGAGQAFALLPPENATGNYIKVVQRVPVKILLEEYPRHCPLGPGMSVEPNVRVR
jgi:membrane fusion protein (multidrug efflux system)